MSDGKRILVVDDDDDIVSLVCTLLSKEGFLAEGCCCGIDALKALQSDNYDLVILDIMMPGIDGYETCRRIRAASDIPVIFLSAKDEEISQVVGLEIGADDYIVKPFRTFEFIARVKARLRRSPAQGKSQDSTLITSDSGLEISLDTHRASLYGTELKLTPKEFDILTLLLKRKDKTVAPKEIYETIWNSGFDASAGNSVMVHIRHLREKLAEIDPTKEFIVNEWGVGYKIPSKITRRR